MKPGFNPESHPGEERLQQAIRRRRPPAARSSAPTPYDDDWGWWIETRLARLETGQKWLITLAGGALFAELIRLALNAIGIIH